MRLHLLLLLLIIPVDDGSASLLDVTAESPIPVVELVQSTEARTTTDTVDAVVRYVLHEASDAIELRLRSVSDNGKKQENIGAVEHRFKIEGMLSDWIMVDRGYHRVTGVKQGVYNLRVQARLPGKAWSKEVRIHLHVERPGGTSWLLYGLLTILIVPSAYYTRVLFRRRSLQRRQEYERIRADERRRIARDLHDDVGTDLARIVVLSDAVAAGGGSNETATAIAETAREVIERVRTIVWVMKSENDSVEAMLSYVHDRVSELLRDHEIAFTYENDQPMPCAMNGTARWNVLMCIKEIATNIVRHSKATAVGMHVSCQRGYLSIRITDNGIGFSIDDVEANGGLLHIRDRMLEIGGTAGIGSRQTEGTNILLVVPVEQRTQMEGELVQ